MVVKITRAKVLRRCLRPVRQVTADTRVMKGPAREEKALHSTTCGITAADRGRIAPNGRPISRLAGIAADGGQGKDAAAEARVLSRQKEGVLTAERGRGYAKN